MTAESSPNDPNAVRVPQPGKQQLLPNQPSGKESGLIDALVDRHANALYGYALKRVTDVNTAEDLVQETFLAVISNPASFAGAAERTWLIGILKHKIGDHFRKECRQCAGSDDVSDDQNEPFFKWIPHWKRYPKTAAPDAGSLMENQEFWEVFERCRATLPPRVSQAFCMKMIDEQNSEEVCQILGVTPTNLWVILHRARAKLAIVLKYIGSRREIGLTQASGRNWTVTMLSCRQATRLVSEGLDHQLTIWQRIILRGHLIICIACRTYRRQVVMLDAIIREHFRRQQEDGSRAEDAADRESSENGPHLTTEARDRIKTNLHRDNQ